MTTEQNVPDRVVATDAAVQLLTKLSELHGGLMIHQSGGCCDGSAPMCYPVGEYRVGQRDVLVGEIDLPEPFRQYGSGSTAISSNCGNTRS